MKRGELGRRIEYHIHPKYGGKVPIYLDTARSLFSGIIGDVVLQHEQLSGLRKLINEALKSQTDLKWISVIEISFGWQSSRNEDRNVINQETQLRAKRYWIAQKIDGNWIESEWDVEHWPDNTRKPKIEIGDRLERSKSFSLSKWNKDTRDFEPIKDLKLPYTKKREDRDEWPEYYVPYTEELWSALQEISKRMEILQNKLVEILGSTQKREQLIAQAQKLLPSPKEG